MHVQKAWRASYPASCVMGRALYTTYYQRAHSSGLARMASAMAACWARRARAPAHEVAVAAERGVAQRALGRRGAAKGL